MFVGQFDPNERVIWVEVRVFGPLGHRQLKFIFDTGTPVTILNTAIADNMGYGANMGTGRSRLLGPEGAQEGYRLRVDRLEALGFVMEPCELFCHDFDEQLGVDGLIGMDLLAGKIVTIDGAQGLITVAP
jgi:hypothetical protein